MKTLTWQKPGQQNVAQELIKIIINYVAELRLYTDVVSSNAMDLFRTSDVKVDFVQEVPFIWNRDHTGWCPVETMCSEEESAEAILQLIRGFLERIKNKE